MCEHVDGRLVALPAGIDAAALEAGDTVALTVRTAGALSAQESLEDLATEGLRAEVVGVEAVAEAAKIEAEKNLTKAQEISLNFHVKCEQFVHFAEGSFFNFNGTTFVPNTNCTNFAVGGGRVNNLSNSSSPSSTNPFSIPYQMATASSSLTANDLVIVDGGGND